MNALSRSIPGVALAATLGVLALVFAACALQDPAPTHVIYDLGLEVQWSPQAGLSESAMNPLPTEALEAARAGSTETGAEATLLLALPSSQPVSFFLRLPVASRLDVSSISGDAGAQIDVGLRLSGEAESRTVGTLAVTDSPQSIELRPHGAASPIQDQGMIAQLSLTSSQSSGSLLLRAPQVRSLLGEAAENSTGDRDNLARQEARRSQWEDTVAPGQADATGRSVVAGRPSVFLFVVDTLRVDHLGVFGYDRNVSPNIDAFAQDAFVFDDATAQSSWTRPTVATVFTGLEPPIHHLDYFEGFLPTGNLTLAEFLQDSGYATEGLIANSIIRTQFGFGQGFERFTYRIGKNDAESVVDYSIKRIGQLKKRLPVFYYIHTMDPHIPYGPPDSMVQAFAADVSFGPEVDAEAMKKLQREGIDQDDPRVGDLLRIYDAEIANVDHHFGRFLEALRDKGLYDSSLILFINDHGEAFWDRGRWGHGHDLHQELMRVPLMIKAPGLSSGGHRIDDLASQVDLFKTIADYVGLEVPDFVRGRSLRPAIEGTEQEIDPDHSVYAATDYLGYLGVSVTTKHWKLIVPRSEKMGVDPILFDRSADPGEWQNVYDQHPVVVGYLQTLLREHEAQDLDWIEPESDEVTPEEKAELEALGYL